MAFAPDGLTALGGYPGDDEKGGAAFGKVDRAKMTEDFVAAARWLKARPDATGKIGVVGFCFGGGISNMLAVKLGGDLAARCRHGVRRRRPEPQTDGDRAVFALAKRQLERVSQPAPLAGGYHDAVDHQLHRQLGAASGHKARLIE